MNISQNKELIYQKHRKLQEEQNTICYKEMDQKIEKSPNSNTSNNQRTNRGKEQKREIGSKIGIKGSKISKERGGLEQQIVPRTLKHATKTIKLESKKYTNIVKDT